MVRKSTLRRRRRKNIRKRTRRGGGSEPRKLEIKLTKAPFKGANGKIIIRDTTVGECVKELIEFSYFFYSRLLSREVPITIICGGQSPAYYCLAMKHFSIYNPDLVDIVVLPHSKGGAKTAYANIESENRRYCERLKEKGVVIKNTAVIIDGVHSGVGIRALEMALHNCYPGITIRKVAINTVRGIAEIPVDEEYTLSCESLFSDKFPRIVQAFYPRNFNNSSKFITDFIIDGNPFADMIIDIASKYPEVKVEDTDWYKLNI